MCFKNIYGGKNEDQSNNFKFLVLETIPILISSNT